MTTKLVPSFLALLTVAVSAASAQTTYIGGNGKQITDVTQWDNGLPTSLGNLGTISGGANIQMDTPPDGYFINQTGG